MDDYLAKPMKLEELTNVLKMAVPVDKHLIYPQTR